MDQSLGRQGSGYHPNRTAKRKKEFLKVRAVEESFGTSSILTFSLQGSCCCCCCVASVLSNSVQPHRRQPTRLPHPWEPPGKNTGVGCHFLLQCMKVKSEREVAQLCPTLSNPMDCIPPGSSIHGIFQARVLEWGAIAFSTRVLEGDKRDKGGKDIFEEIKKKIL